jgi:hypothetical protein
LFLNVVVVLLFSMHQIVDDEVVAFSELERLCEAWSVPMMACSSGIRGRDVKRKKLFFFFFFFCILFFRLGVMM